jgi:hypothetical protein
VLVGVYLTPPVLIADIKLRFGEKMDAAYRAFVLSEDTHGRHDSQLEKQWSKFKVVFRRVGQAVARSGGSLNAVPASAQTQRIIRPMVSDRRMAPAASSNSNSTQQQLMQVKDLCFEHSKLGACSFGDDCRYVHAGAAGALRHLIVNAAGECVQFNKLENCRRLDRGRCDFLHNPASVQSTATSQQSQPPAAQQRAAPAHNSTAMMSAEQHQQIMDYATAAGRDASTVTLEEVQAADHVYKPPLQKKMFVVLHSEPRSGTVGSVGSR